MDTVDWIASAALAVVLLLSFVKDVRQLARWIVRLLAHWWRALARRFRRS
jgi:predicted PurR-regulated permease PerM